MGETDRSAAGSAAGYHYQAQRALITLLREPPDSGRELGMETLDDLTLSNRESLVELEQLKHSVRAGTLTDRTPALWGALDNWMDHLGTSRMDRIANLILISTDTVAEGSGVRLLRDSNDRQPSEAERRLVLVAEERPGNQATKEARERFAGLNGRDRGSLLSKVIVRDGTPPITEFRSQLRSALGLALPQNGVDDFLDQLVGWWERRVVDLLVRRLKTVSYDEVADEVARLRNMYNDSELPPADPNLRSLSDALVDAYSNAAFVHQLQFVALHDQRIRIAISDYHRAYAQRSIWLQEGILGAEELLEWEQRLVDEWQRAWVRMLEAVQQADEDGTINAGRALLGELEDSSLNPLRSGRDRFLHTGTLHGLADSRHVGWHRDYEARLAAKFGPMRGGQRTSSTFEEVGGSA